MGVGAQYENGEGPLDSSMPETGFLTLFYGNEISDNGSSGIEEKGLRSWYQEVQLTEFAAFFDLEII